MADEDTILEARKLVPHYTRQISWLADSQVWQVAVPEIPGCFGRGDSAESANRDTDERILLHLLGMRTSEWPMPKRLRQR